MNASDNKVRIYLRWIIIVSIATLVAPFMYLKIGPGGYEYYGPDVPDIYILGGTILGKDRSWWGINLAYKFQLTTILVYTLMAAIAYFKSHSKVLTTGLMSMGLGLLILFPLWMGMYTNGVINNSDGADLTVYLHVGWGLYLILLTLNILTLVQKSKSSSSKD